MKNQDELASAFKALSDPTRLKIVECLRSCCTPMALEEDGIVRPLNGPTVGEVCCQVTGAEKITSTLSAHLKELRLAGLVTMEKRGKYVICHLNRERLEALADYLKGTKNGCC